jgi:hypothetical protein
MAGRMNSRTSDSEMPESRLNIHLCARGSRWDCIAFPKSHIRRFAQPRRGAVHSANGAACSSEGNGGSDDTEDGTVLVQPEMECERSLLEYMTISAARLG